MSLDAPQDRAGSGGESIDTKNHPPRISIVTPAFNESANLPLLYDRIRAALEPIPVVWEWVVVDDYSSDGTFEVLSHLAQNDPRVRGFRFARNSGSHKALTCGLREALGDCAAIMAADLQDPPEILGPMIHKWMTGSQVVWAVRSARHGEAASTVIFARMYYWLMRRFVGLQQMPPSGADFFLLDRRVLDAFRSFREHNTSLMSLILWMGFRQDSVSYEKQARVHGSSKWNLEMKLKLLVDSVTAFTYKPLRYMSYAGFTIATLGFFYALVVIINALAGHPVEGWTSLMVVMLVLGGFQMLMMGVLGEYLWRVLDEARQRPLYLIETTVGRSTFLPTAVVGQSAPMQPGRYQ
ncbi:MAG: glycosyltransferase family 2 protein [Bryobacteraceae bacterium]